MAKSGENVSKDSILGLSVPFISGLVCHFGMLFLKLFQVGLLSFISFLVGDMKNQSFKFDYELFRDKLLLRAISVNMDFTQNQRPEYLINSFT